MLLCAFMQPFGSPEDEASASDERGSAVSGQEHPSTHLNKPIGAWKHVQQLGSCGSLQGFSECFFWG